MKKALSLLTLLALAACGGGAGSSLPTGTASHPQLQNVSVQFSIAIPASVGRVPQYISSATKSAQITVTPTGGAALTPVILSCTTSCSGTVQAPVGSDTFAVSLFDQTGATGHTLSTGSATQTIVAGTANSVMLTFGGVVAQIIIGLGATSVTGSGSTPVTVTAKDGAGQTIVGSDAYANPITLSDTDASGGTNLSTTLVTSPATAVTLNYTGAFTQALIGAAAPGVSASAVTTATLTRAAAAPPAAFMTQTTSTKVNGTVNAGATKAIAVAASELADPMVIGGGGSMPLGSLSVGTGSSAQSIARLPLGIEHAAVAAGRVRVPVEAHPAVGTHELLSHLRRSSPSTVPVRRVSSSTIPSSPVVGNTANIWVAVFTIGSGTGNNTAVPATLEAQTAHGNIWVDNTLLSGAHASPSFQGGALSATANTIAADFENAYSSDTSHFASPDYPVSAAGLAPTYTACDASGNPSGTAQQYIAEPADKRIDVMVLNSQNLGSGVGGYFGGTNYIPQALLNCNQSGGHPTAESNEAPIIFVGWFESNAAAYELQEDLVRGTAHELQHLINFVNHVILPAGASSGSFNGEEDSFVNEGLSMLAQDLAVHNLYPGMSFDVDDAMQHAAGYLAAPQNFSVPGFIGIDAVADGGDGVTVKYNCSSCYGAAYLFQRYMRDRFGGDAYTQSMETSGLVGFSNFVHASGTSETGQQLLGDFGVAMASSSAGVTSTNPAFSFGTLNLLGTYSDAAGPNLSGGATLTGAAVLNAAPNATTLITPPVGGFEFLNLTSIPAGGESISITDTSTGGTFGLAGGLVQR